MGQPSAYLPQMLFSFASIIPGLRPGQTRGVPLAHGKRGISVTLPPALKRFPLLRRRLQVPFSDHTIERGAIDRFGGRRDHHRAGLRRAAAGSSVEATLLIEPQGIDADEPVPLHAVVALLMVDVPPPTGRTLWNDDRIYLVSVPRPGGRFSTLAGHYAGTLTPEPSTYPAIRLPYACCTDAIREPYACFTAQSR